MLIGLKKPVKPGAKLELTLTFEHAPSVRVVAVAMESEEDMADHKMSGESMGAKHKMK